jgi:hypothetical protein
MANGASMALEFRSRAATLRLARLVCSQTAPQRVVTYKWSSDQMNQIANYFAKSAFMVTCLTIGCTGSGMAGCGSSADGGPKVDSDLPGVYAIDSYRSSPVDPDTGEPVPDSCDQLSDTSPFGEFLVVYSFQPNPNSDQVRLAGVFCSTVESCRQIAKDALEPTLGYSFLQGDDENGWLGFGISRTGFVGDQCQADVQRHILTSSGQAINITTDTVETVFPPTVDGDQATCRNGDAIGAITPDLPCKARLVLDATHEASL